MNCYTTDLWQIGIVQAPIQHIVASGSLDGFRIKWITPDKSLTFLADPFGLWKKGVLYLFAESYDYRTRRGDIIAYKLNADLDVIEQRTVPQEPWHLSYPFVFEADNEIWMLPEGYKSGTLTLYRAIEFPWRWEKVPDFSFPCAAIDATPFYAQGKWWMFYTPPLPKAARTDTLMLAHAPHFMGPWENVLQTAAHRNKSGARMGGTPFDHDGQIFLPTQDCSRTYGGALQMLTLDPQRLLTPEFAASVRLEVPASAAPFIAGMHTLSGVGDVTFIDAKRHLKGSPQRLWVDLQRRIQKWIS